MFLWRIAPRLDIGRFILHPYCVTNEDRPNADRPAGERGVNWAIRARILAARPQELGIDPATISDTGSIWGVVMETAYFAGVVTLIALANGTAFLLFSNGGGVEGTTDHHQVRDAARRLVSKAGDHAAGATASESCPYPRVGRTRFYLLATTGVRVLEAAEDELESTVHELSSLFLAGHDVITQLRHIAQSA